MLIPIFALISSLLVLAPAAAWCAPQVLDRVEASVNSALVLTSDIKHFKKTLGLRAQLDPLFSGTTVAAQGTNAKPQDVVEFLINEKLILQAFPVADSEVEQEINSIQANNRIDRAGLKAALKEQGYDFEDYFELIRASVAKRTLIDRDIRTKVTVSEDDLKNFYLNQYSKGSSIPLAYNVRIITVTHENYKTPAAARDVAQRARKAITEGEAFEEVAKRASDGPTAQTGGDLGVLTEDQMSPSVVKTLKKLKIGEISDVIENPAGGFMILKLVDVNSTQGDHFTKVKEEIRAQLAASEYQRQIVLWLERQRAEAFIHRAGERSIPGLAKEKAKTS